MKRIKCLFLDPATGRYVRGLLEGADDAGVEREIARILGARHVAALTIPPEAEGELELAAWTDLEARIKPQTCCWTRSGSGLAVPGRTVLTGMADGAAADVPFAADVVDGRIATYVARVSFPRPGPEPEFETIPTPVLERTYAG